MTMTPELKAELDAAFAESWMRPRCYLGRDIEGELMLAGVTTLWQPTTYETRESRTVM